MPFKTTLNYSPNFNSKKRQKKDVRFIILHYTGMKSEKAAINKLTNIQSKVASHYLISEAGKIINFVPDLYIAWHAGISSWKGIKSLNKYSIGIEITNPGHVYNYKNFSLKQINSILKLTKFLIKKYKIQPQNILGHSDIAPYRKKDPGEKFPWKYLYQNKIGIWHSLNQNKLLKLRGLKTNKIEKKKFIKNLFKIGYNFNFKKNLKLDKDKNLKIISKTFQRRFRPDVVNGIIDKECLLISQNLA